MEAVANCQENAVPDMHVTKPGFQVAEADEDTLTSTHQSIEKYKAGSYLLNLVENKFIKVPTYGSVYTLQATPTTAPLKRFKIVTRLCE